MTRCGYGYEVEGSERACPRPVAPEEDRCVFHLSLPERQAAGITPSALRAAILEDFEATDPTRREYVDVHLDELDLSSIVLDGHDTTPITFRKARIDGELDLSGSVVGHPLDLEDCRVGEMDATGTVFERNVTIEGTTIGKPIDRATCFRGRHASFDRNLRVSDTRFQGSVEFAGCSVRERLAFDGVTVDGRAHFPNVSFGRIQLLGSRFQAVEFVGATGDHATFDAVRVDEGGLDLSAASFDQLRVFPDADLECCLRDATVSAGKLSQPDTGVATYDFTDATVGDVDLDSEPHTFDRYRFYRTRFDGFHFASSRELLRANRWRLHGFVGDAVEPDTVEGLEHTYLEAKQGASEMGDGETASTFAVRELRYRRRHYASQARTRDHSLTHRTDTALRWVTNGFLDAVAGYGERPQRTAALALAVIVGTALAYPATLGLAAGGEVVRYTTRGAPAVIDGLYFSVVTFATLGLGDVHPVGDFGRLLAASEGLAGALLTAIFVFSLGRRTTR